MLVAAGFFGAVGLAVYLSDKEEQRRKDATASRFRQIGFGATSTPREFEQKLAFEELRDLPQIWKKNEWRAAYYPASDPAPKGIVLIARGVMGNQQVSYIEHVRIVGGGNRPTRRLFDYCIVACIPAGQEAPPKEGLFAAKISDIPALTHWSNHTQKQIELFRQDQIRFAVIKKRLSSTRALSFANTFAMACNEL